jgi:glycosyltransferase involved in cell wall biosynthesis
MTVAVKGYEQPFGRALMALRAIDLGAEQLRQFSFEVFSATPKVRKEAARIAREKHLSINVLPYVPNEEIVALMGRSRFAVGVSASDGVPNAMLEAMIMGALPIQTNTAALDGWIENGVNGLSVDLSVDNILQAMIRAATDDRLVDDAARMNGDITERRLATTVVVPRVHAMYRHVAEHGSIAADAGRPGEV